MRAIPIATGGTVWIPANVRADRCVRALRLVGYRLDSDARGRLIAHRLH